MGILNWLKSRKKETPAQAARRRMAQENTTEVGHPEPTPATQVGQDLPSLDPSAIAGAYSWQSDTKEQRTSPEAVKQKIIDNLAQHPKRRQWTKVEYQQNEQVETTINVEESSQVVMEQISFDQVGISGELKKP